MDKTKKDAVWVEIDPETLDVEQAEAYRLYKDGYRAMKELRAAFEATMSGDVPEGKRMIFGYNFGKLSVAIVADDRKPKRDTRKLSLAEYLALEAAAGRAS